MEGSAEVLKEVQPDLICTAIRLGPWAPAARQKILGDKARKLPQAAWLPYYMQGMYRFMQAVKKSGIQTHVVNASLPDVVGPVIWKHFGIP